MAPRSDPRIRTPGSYARCCHPSGLWFGLDDLIVAAVGFVVGFVSGIHGIYDWTSVGGWFAFLSDSTWGLIGTSLGNVAYLINLFYDDANYREDLSRRQNRHVHEGGFALKNDMAFTQGNVISNAGLGQGAAGISPSFIAEHEELHIWQSRFFGPLFQTTYIVWAVGGFLVATVVWFTDTSEDWGSPVETAAYYDNPFETWAYKNNSYWPPVGANKADLGVSGDRPRELTAVTGVPYRAMHRRSPDDHDATRSARVDHAPRRALVSKALLSNSECLLTQRFRRV